MIVRESAGNQGENLGFFVRIRWRMLRQVDFDRTAQRASALSVDV